MVKYRYHWGKLRGLGHGLGNLVFLLTFQSMPQDFETRRRMARERREVY